MFRHIAEDEPYVVAQRVREMEPLYEMTVDDREPTAVTASALIEAWRENAPQGAARALDLAIGSQAVIMESPLVVVRRLR